MQVACSTAGQAAVGAFQERRPSRHIVQRSKCHRAGRRAVQLVSAAASQEAPADPFAEKTVYKDSYFDRAMIWYFSSVMSKQLGDKPFDGTWDGFVDLSREIMRGRNSKEQQETVAGVLAGLLPPQAPERFRRWFPLNKRNAEFNAFITVLGFAWLVGPSEQIEVEVDYQGRTEKWRSGLPLHMEPDFNDLSCKMTFGRHPPPVEQDKVYNQPCFATQCNLGTVGSKNLNQPCPKIDTERTKKEAAAAKAAVAAAAGSGGGFRWPWQKA